MNLPAELGLAVSKALDGVDHRALSDVASEISTAYRAQRRSGSAYLTSDAHRLAYLAVRLPATYAAVLSACSYTADIVGDVPIRSCLALGAGPGTASWARRAPEAAPLPTAPTPRLMDIRSAAVITPVPSPWLCPSAHG